MHFGGWEGAAGAAIVISAYLFQIVRLAMVRVADGVSVSSYLLWAAASALMLVHALAIKSTVFIILTGSHLAACVVIAGLALWFGRSARRLTAAQP